MRNSSVLEELDNFKSLCKQIKVPLPENGFQTQVDIFQWNNKLFAKTNLPRTLWFNKILKQAVGKVSRQEYKELVDHLERSLLLEDINKKGYKGFDVLLPAQLNIKSEAGVYLQIFPHTTKKDILNNWGYIQKAAKRSTGWGKTKNKPDPLVIPVMETYVKAKPLGVATRSGVDRRRPIAVEKLVQKMLPKKYLTSTENIRRIIKKYRYLEAYFK